jgi:hypothetical protein
MDRRKRNEPLQPSRGIKRSHRSRATAEHSSRDLRVAPA